MLGIGTLPSWHAYSKINAVALAHTKLRDQTASRTAKEYWTTRLDALAAVLAASSD